MSIFDALNVASAAMDVHRYRSEVAAENLSNIYTNPGYQRKIVDVASGDFSNALDKAQAGGEGHGYGAATQDAADGVIRVAGVHREGPMDQREQAYLSTIDMMQSKNAYEMSVRAATMLKSMALSSLEIGRGG